MFSQYIHPKAKNSLILYRQIDYVYNYSFLIKKEKKKQPRKQAFLFIYYKICLDVIHIIKKYSYFCENLHLTIDR